MAKKLSEVIKKISQERQERIEARSQELIAEYITFQVSRAAREFTQERSKKKL